MCSESDESESDKVKCDDFESDEIVDQSKKIDKLNT